ncbi:uncharacterized protein KY384_003983 [Bacidia gigantensis]|uniref:uncharacterized protein n=1 Tax=Bacidia gigantensis TaxID=2732470 RepID=UPI001D036614|nr:uncharacterized protein KY384_003983 [Bacidia gigantensis]KAG8532342.1 hypothetical protein KY384_003983 [Bacidia gigantensis]
MPQGNVPPPVLPPPVTDPPRDNLRHGPWLQILDRAHAIGPLPTISNTLAEEDIEPPHAFSQPDTAINSPRPPPQVFPSTNPSPSLPPQSLQSASQPERADRNPHALQAPEARRDPEWWRIHDEAIHIFDTRREHIVDRHDEALLSQYEQINEALPLFPENRPHWTDQNRQDAREHNQEMVGTKEKAQPDPNPHEESVKDEVERFVKSEAPPPENPPLQLVPAQGPRSSDNQLQLCFLQGIAIYLRRGDIDRWRYLVETKYLFDPIQKAQIFSNQQISRQDNWTVRFLTPSKSIASLVSIHDPLYRNDGKPLQRPSINTLGQPGLSILWPLLTQHEQRALAAYWNALPPFNRAIPNPHPKDASKRAKPRLISEDARGGKKWDWSGLYQPIRPEFCPCFPKSVLPTPLRTRRQHDSNPHRRLLRQSAPAAAVPELREWALHIPA